MMEEETEEVVEIPKEEYERIKHELMVEGNKFWTLMGENIYIFDNKERGFRRLKELKTKQAKEEKPLQHSFIELEAKEDELNAQRITLREIWDEIFKLIAEEEEKEK